MKLTLFLFLLLPCLAFSQTPVFSVSATQTTICLGSTTQLSATVNVVQTPLTTTPLNETSGTAYNCDCPTGYVAVGYQGRTGEVLDQLTLACKKLNPDGSLDSTVVYTTPAGGDSGVPNGPFAFTNNTALVGINLNNTGNGYYKYVATSITGYGQPTSTIAAGDSNSTAGVTLTTMSGTYLFYRDAGTVYVPDGHVVTGIRVTNSTGIDDNGNYVTYVGSVALRYLPIAALFPPSPYTITWSSGQTGSPITVSPDHTTSYTATAANAYGTLPPASLTITVNTLPTPYSVTGGGAYCQGSAGLVVGLSGSQMGVNYQLQRDGNPVGSPVAGTSSALNFGNQTTAGTYTVLATNASTSCQQAMNGSTTVTITPQPSAPMIVTQSGYAYPAGVSSLTIAQNVGPVSLTVAGCSGGMLMANGNAASSFTVSTAMTGTQTYTATCTQGGCTSPVGSFQLTVLPTTLSVLHQDVDYGQTQDQIIKPFLKLANAGGQPVPYGEITVRYWFTSEGNSPPTDFQLYYAQLGAVTMKYVPLAQPRQGAFGYVEYSFPGGGSLPANGNSGPIENGILKKDRSNFNETDDYSYQPNRDYLPNARITAYRKGADGVPVIVWGQEPTPVASQTAVQVYSAAKDGGITSQIQTRLELRNTGNVALPVSALKLRYYFTSDNGQTANVYVDYADLGASNVQARVVRLAAPVNGADSYVELSFPGNPRQLGPLSSLGVIDFRLVRSDFGLFNQGNDYSYAPIYGPVGLNNRVTVLLNNTLIFGTPPSGAPARVGAPEPMLALQVTVLGNPVVGDQAQIEIRGAEGQVVNVQLVDLQGRTVHEQRIEQAAETQPVSLPLGQSRGLLLLKVSTASQQQRLKLVRP